MRVAQFFLVGGQYVCVDTDRDTYIDIDIDIDIDVDIDIDIDTAQCRIEMSHLNGAPFFLALKHSERLNFSFLR